MLATKIDRKKLLVIDDDATKLLPKPINLVRIIHRWIQREVRTLYWLGGENTTAIFKNIDLKLIAFQKVQLQIWSSAAGNTFSTWPGGHFLITIDYKYRVNVEGGSVIV